MNAPILTPRKISMPITRRRATIAQLDEANLALSSAIARIASMESLLTSLRSQVHDATDRAARQSLLIDNLTAATGRSTAAADVDCQTCASLRALNSEIRSSLETERDNARGELEETQKKLSSTRLDLESVEGERDEASEELLEVKKASALRLKALQAISAHVQIPTWEVCPLCALRGYHRPDCALGHAQEEIESIDLDDE